MAPTKFPSSFPKQNAADTEEDQPGEAKVSLCDHPP